ncbi:MAG: ATP-binding cassette domain-containing protein [Bacteroidota bacterium]|nr:ATP-binding cassette domain-containing protein [Bacteroidota bacterium]MDP4216061.1 ATP-binding cassette domain-containing protein [Bacteroidota bacterium]MDP4246127.1 ATP-binding cassette domain-containing protein [Bacteroidota bacterium]MDP4252448.1 ATP-binding cassette domain-containing protein [Bacteroidota bacterium]MDP4256632.1 ATP-binding cassette domain-containing protein [Bacteroidota bacterium]
MTNILNIRSITKFYGKIRALHEVSFDVPPGSVYGVLGPNGSGKTTLLGIVMDVLQSSGGEYAWFGQPPSSRHRRQIGTLLETPNFYHYLSGERNLKIAAAIKGHGEEDIPRVLETVKLTGRRHSKFSTYSLGMKQRLAIASCLLGNPSVLVFDEPTNGLDPVGIAETRQLILDLSREGKTILLASHLLDEVEKVCSHVAILQKGQLLMAGHVNEVLTNEDYVELGARDMQKLAALLSGYPGVRQVKPYEQSLQVYFEQNNADLDGINQYCFENGVVLNHLQLRKRSLESKFMELTNT